MIATLATLKNFPKNTASWEHKKNGDGKGQDFSLLHLLVGNAPNNPPPATITSQT
jgi:hypothetical protein